MSRESEWPDTLSMQHLTRSKRSCRNAQTTLSAQRSWSKKERQEAWRSWWCHVWWQWTSARQSGRKWSSRWSKRQA